MAKQENEDGSASIAQSDHLLCWTKNNNASAWVLNKTFRAQGDEADYYKLRSEDMIQMQEALFDQYKSRVQSLPDAGDEETNTTVLEMIQPLRRPGPDTDDSEQATTPAAPTMAPKRNRGAVQRPHEPMRGPCQCCFEEISTRNSLSCARSLEHSSSHFFCKDCIRRYVGEWVFGGADYELKESRTNTLPCLAMDCADGYIPHEVVEEVCLDNAALWEKYQEKVFRMEAFAAMPLDDAARPGKLDAASRSYSDPPEVVGGLGDNDIDTYSPPRTRRRSFGDQQRAPEAVPQRSADSGDKKVSAIKRVVSRAKGKNAAKDKQSSSPSDEDVNRVTEAMSHAKLRKCPRCEVSFIKESGCNRIKCPACRQHMCYICRFPGAFLYESAFRLTIVALTSSLTSVPRHGYDHFCQHAYDSCRSCSKCPLWTRNDEKMDSERIEEVATNIANKLWGEALLREAERTPVNVQELIEAGNTKRRPGLFGRLTNR